MAAASGGDTEVRDNPERRRFELSLGADGVAFVDYRDQLGPPGAPRVRMLTHAEVPAAQRGAGVGARLVGATLDLIRARGERALPRCPFVVDFIHRHPEYSDVLADRPGG